MMGGYGSGMGWAWMFWLLLIVGVVLLAGAGIWFFSARRRRGGPTGSPDGSGAGPAGSGGTPREILDERFARGELTAEEYQERLKILKGES
ncbi:SHOCT domain-containing protein [Paenarthrobacter sp. DKR-5]|uniref:SHOCT domain-containing protein n=1 Tax=Paenarthrobacter sp. DKR-5 TaxID=2835535 RepID=UPI001BDD51AA|nr:SHOCT domain-containing protein [Paenarthrobacter sp. DKR-5]MBT1003904.1 SHOCT domain-containing protein [Paenarthrobacter sp. DKR-5]